MSREHRVKVVPLGPLPRSRAWLAGGALASLSLVLAGFVSPVVAAAQQAGPAAATAGPAGGGGEDHCKRKPHHRGDEDDDRPEAHRAGRASAG
ncbi:hypothetical protein PL81_25135, partial [Streptomyces sp. RSD-27]